MDVCVEIVISSKEDMHQFKSYRSLDTPEGHFWYGNYVKLQPVPLPHHIGVLVEVDKLIGDYQTFSLKRESIDKLEDEVNGYSEANGYTVDWGNLSLEQFLHQLFTNSTIAVLVFEMYCDTIDKIYHISSTDELIKKLKQNLRADMKREGFIAVYSNI
jgi:hypothetical protein